jgi:hypothetical protein
MNDDDLLSRMTRALSDEYDGATAVPEATRARVIRNLSERRPRRRMWLSIGVPLFVIFGGSTAWAAASGKLNRVVETAILLVTGQVPEDQPAKPPSIKSGSLRSTPSPAPPATSETAAPEIEPEEETESTAQPTLDEEDLDNEKGAEQKKVAAVSQPPRSPKNMGRAPVTERKETAPPQASTELEPEDHTALLTYRSAHRAHFSEGNCLKAISGYERYLRLEPQGPFAADARYNRGVCLLRVGRAADAQLALRPFAEGQYGAYRSTEAQQLLEAIDQAPEP